MRSSREVAPMGHHFQIFVENPANEQKLENSASTLNGTYFGSSERPFSGNLVPSASYIFTVIFHFIDIFIIFSSEVISALNCKDLPLLFLLYF